MAAILDHDRALQERRCAALARRDGLLREVGLGPGPDKTITTRYAFRHALYQDAIEAQLSAGRRCFLHRRAGQCLEAVHTGNPQAIALALADHFEQGHDPDRASHYYQQASQTALSHHAPRDAVLCLEKAVTLLQELPESPERDRRELELQLALGPLLTGTVSWASPALERTYHRAEALCRRLGHLESRFPVLWGLWAGRVLRAEYAAARVAAADLFPLAEALQDDGLRLEAQIAVGLTRMWTGEFGAARAALDQALALYDAEHHRSHTLSYGQDPRMLCLAHRAWLNAWLGFPNQARRDGEDALIQAQRVDHPHSRVFALVYQAILGLYLNDLSLLRVGAMQVIDRANAHGFGQWLIFAHFFEGWAWTHDGQVEAGMTRMQNSLAEHRATCARWGESLFLTLLADAHGCAGQIDSALALVDEALAIARKTGEGFYLAEAYRLKGELLWRGSSPQPEAAEACWQQALTIARNQGARAWEWRAVSRLTEAWRERERGLTGLHDGPRRYASASRTIPTTISGSDSNCPMVSQPKAR